MKFIHCSDFHLGAEPESGKPWGEARKEELWQTVTRILNVCDAEETDLLLISGNMFHRQPLLKELKRLNEMFKTLVKTKVVFIAGNNDYIGPRSRYRGFDWCEQVVPISDRELKEIYFYGLDTTVYGFSYMESEITESLLRDVRPKKSSGIHILLAHGGDARHLPIDFARLEDAGFDYVALGHRMKHEKITERICYAGIPEPVDRTDVGEHGYIKGEFIREGAGYRLETEFVPFALRNYIDIHVRISTDDNNVSAARMVTDGMLKNGAGNLYRIFLEGIRNKDVVFDKRALALKGMITEVVDATVLDYNYDELMSMHRDDVIGEFISYIQSLEVDESIKDRALYYGVDALLKANSSR